MTGPDHARLAALAVLSAAGADVTRCDLARAAEQVRRELAAAELRGRALQSLDKGEVGRG